MRKVILTIIHFWMLTISLVAQQTIVINDLEDLFDLAEKNALSLDIAEEQYSLSKTEIATAKLNRFNPTGIISASAINNTQLPVNFLPGEVFGQPAGTLQPVQLGQQYVSNINIGAQVDLVNLSAWEKVKSANLNEQLNQLNKQITKKSLAENVATTYFNIISNQEQILILQQNLENNDSILHIITNKYEEGIVRQQDVNQAKVNQLMIEDKISQLQFNVQQQINNLKLLCDISPEQRIRVNYADKKTLNTYSGIANNSLLSTQYQLQKDIASQEVVTVQKNLYPTLSLIGNWSWQDNSNSGFFDSGSEPFQSSYIGLRLNYNIPSSSFFSQKQKAEANVKIADMNAQHAFLQEKINNKQLIIDYEKSLSTFKNNEEIVDLKTDTFFKNKNIFESDLIPTDQLLLSLNDMINAILTQKINEINCYYYLTKIEINQRY